MSVLNNPFNIRANSDSKRFVGVVGEQSGFLMFSEVYYCVRAVLVILTQYRKRGVSHISDIINTYAPPTENNTSKYISFVCDKLAVHSSYDIDVRCPLMLFRFLRAVALFESGYALSESVFDEGYYYFCLYKNPNLFEL